MLQLAVRSVFLVADKMVSALTYNVSSGKLDHTVTYLLESVHIIVNRFLFCDNGAAWANSFRCFLSVEFKFVRISVFCRYIWFHFVRANLTNVQ